MAVLTYKIVVDKEAAVAEKMLVDLPRFRGGLLTNDDRKENP